MSILKVWTTMHPHFLTNDKLKIVEMNAVQPAANLKLRDAEVWKDGHITCV